MNGERKLFAFELAAKQDAKRRNADDRAIDRWKARDGVATAGCTEYLYPDNLREYSATRGADRGYYC